MLYKDFYMTGWSCRDVIPDDVNLVPIIDGRGKQCRLMATMGVARGIGDHDLVKTVEIASFTKSGHVDSMT